jgi:hypothetical protein
LGGGGAGGEGPEISELMFSTLISWERVHTFLHRDASSTAEETKNL